MNAWMLVTPNLVVIAFVGGLYLLLPRISRRGLLFGVYVGEAGAGAEEARAITRSWYRRMAIWLAGSLVGGTVATLLLNPVTGMPVGTLVWTAGFLWEYLRAYRRACRLAPAGPPPLAVAIISGEDPKPLILPFLALGLGLAGGLFAIGYAWAHYEALPATVPTHFDLAGRPDAWRPRSFFTVMLVPLMALVMGPGLAGVTLLVGRAKRAIRHPDGGVSLVAQATFRRAMCRLLSVVTILVTALLTLLSVSVVRVGLGKASAVTPLVLGLELALSLGTIGGILYIALRYGQGGSRLERAVEAAPLTDGLADNRRWVLGMFYVDREDPSVFVEHRFGLGYTINLGNWKAVALLLGFLALVLAITITAALTN